MKSLGRVVWLLMPVLLIGAPAAISAENTTPRLSAERVVLRTSMGDIVLALYPDISPQHVAKFIKLSKMGLYDNGVFYLVSPNYVIQVYGIRYGRDQLSPANEEAAKPLRAETSSVKIRRGIVAMAQNLKSPDSDESSFLIALSEIPAMDGKTSILGEVQSGLDVAEAISLVHANAKREPSSPVYLHNVEVTPTAHALSSMGLRPVTPHIEKNSPPILPQGSAWMVAAMMACNFLIFLNARRSRMRLVLCMALLTLLIGFFLIYVHLVPKAGGSYGLAVVIFLAEVGIIKLMTYFETSSVSGPPLSR